MSAEEELQGLSVSSISAAIKDDDEDVADDDSDAETIVSDGKLWKPRRTLRK